MAPPCARAEREPRHERARADGRPRPRSSASAVTSAMCFWTCAFLIFLDYMANCMVEAVFPFLVKDYLGWGAREYSFLFLLFGLLQCLQLLQ